MGIVIDRLISGGADIVPVTQMGSAGQNPVVVRVQSWAEEVRAAEVERALSRFQSLRVKDKRVLECLSRRLVAELLTPPTEFARRTSKTLPNSKRLPIICGMFDRRGGLPWVSLQRPSHPPSWGGISTDVCGMPTIALGQRRSQGP